MQIRKWFEPLIFFNQGINMQIGWNRAKKSSCIFSWCGRKQLEKCLVKSETLLDSSRWLTVIVENFQTKWNIGCSLILSVKSIWWPLINDSDRTSQRFLVLERSGKMWNTKIVTKITLKFTRKLLAANWYISQWFHVLVLNSI